ncbi:MAG: ThiF family adenylyltransferase [Polyangiaceae bacterium]
MTKRVVFCGVGALGSHAAVLSRNLPWDLAFVDFDRVESKNLLSQAFVKPSIGKNKADGLRLQLLNFHGRKTEAFGVRLGDNNVTELLAGADLVVDTFDNAASRVVLSRWARAAAASRALVHAGLSGDGSFGLVRWDERFTADEEDHAGQATCETGEHLPLIALVAATLARTIQDFVATGERRDTLITLKAATPALGG